MPFLLFLFLFFLFFYNYSYYYTQNFLYILRRPRKFEVILTIDKVFGENLKGPLKISAKGKTRQVLDLTFSESFHCRLLFSGKEKNSPKKFERLKPLLGRPNIFFSNTNFSFILLLKHSRMHNEAFQIICQKTVVGCP